jgi:phosphoesterase RecJ-like protein
MNVLNNTLKKGYLRLTHRLRAELSAPQRIVVTTHQGPDGDGLGSSLALYHFLKKQGHDVSVITPNDYPEFLQWLPANADVVNFMRQKPLAEALIEKAEYVFHMDYNHLKRSADMSRSLYQCKAVRILVDHHLLPELPAKFVFSDTDVSSTCELLFGILKQWNDKLIDQTIATCLYTGVMTDTGNFCYRSVTPQTFSVAAELMDYGIDRTEIYDRVYDNYSENRMRLMGFCLNEKMEVFPQYAAALISLNLEEQHRYGFVVGDSEGFVNLPLSIKGIRFSAFFLEKEDKIKMSFRSKGNFSVNDFAKNHYGGGGHLNAAGADAKTPMNELMQQFRELLPLYKKELLP